MERTDAYQLIDREKFATLATVRSNGSPHLVPITFGRDRDVVVTVVDHKPKTTMDLQRLGNIRHNPSVSVLVEHRSDNWSELWWVRLDGLAAIHTEGVAWDHARQVMSDKYHQYTELPPTGPAIVIQVTNVSAWASS